MKNRKPCILVSACLYGQNVRYDGKSKPIDLSNLETQNVTFVPICPECMGGLSIPRTPCEIEPEKTAKDVWSGKAKVVDITGQNKTAAYMKGSRRCLELATRHRADAVLLKDKSPACGSSFVYSGDFSSTLKEGRGVTAELLHENGFRIFSENDIPLLVNYLQNSNN
ncbi:MAG TPA: DUF523 domain-containing protein [Candidatus Aphodousia faecigallinarum]|uniref:DUF523 domain-containing protein n=1 Tax=Candidatus Aphodousia faecigallinarum TaxID=2840677 RepID=A0A9D1IKX1_9BURK|nr:DUF523 domain-containing protein [Candidatus Aphodousia faecigallinarum]